jgi:putative transcriptional regulator
MKKTRPSKAGFFSRLKTAMEDSIAYSRGQLSLKTTVLPAPPPPVSARRVIQIRERYQMSQGVFAAALNVSPRTVQSWEQGSRRPNQGALRLLEIFDRQPEAVRKLFEAPARSGKNTKRTGRKSSSRPSTRSSNDRSVAV